MAEIGKGRRTRSITIESKRRKAEAANTSEKDFEMSNQCGEPTEKPTAQTKAAQPKKKKTTEKANKEAEAKKRATNTGEQLSSARRKGSSDSRAPEKLTSKSLGNAGSKNSNTDQQGKNKLRKCSTKAMKKSDREALLRSLKSIEVSILLCDVVNELRATFDDDSLMKDFAGTLCSSEQLLQEIIVHHQHCFGALYVSSKMEQDAFSLNGTNTAVFFF